MPGWSQRPLFKNPTNMTGGGPVGMPKGMSIPGYQDGNVVQGGNMVEEIPAYRQEQLAKESQYLKAIEETARLFSTSSPKASDYMSNIHYFAGSLSGGHQIPKEQVMQDLMKAIETQRGAPKMKAGGIVGLENGGMMPELFEGEEIVETNPTINEMAGQGGTGIASVSAEPASGAMPERNVPNERGIIELAMDAEEVEDDEPMVAMAKQEAQSLLDQEFNILKSTAKAEAASGNSPSMVIKSGMDDLARSARRIENEVTEKYPEVPANTNLISSDDLIPYREQLVAVFEMPEIGGEEPLMDTSILTAKNGGKIPGYQDGGVADVPEEWSWIDEDIRELGVSLDVAEQLMEKRYGDITKEVVGMAEQSRPSRINQFLSGIKKRKEAEGLSFEELAQLAKEEADKKNIPQEQERQKLLGMLTETPGFEIASKRVGGVRSNLMDPKTRAIYDQYKLFKEASTEPLSAVQGQAAAQTGDQGQGDPIIESGLPTTEEMIDQGTVSAGGNTAIPPNFDQMTPEEKINILAQLLQQGDPLADVRKQAETLKGTTEKSIEGITSILDKSIGQYEKDAKKQDKDMRNIFDDIERRIPEQAKYQALTSPASGGMGSQYWGRKFKGKELEQNLFQENNRNKIEFENLRKKETEARRNQDVKALYDIKLKQYEVLSGIDKSMLDAEAALAQSQIENQMAMELEQLKIELGTTGQTYGFEASMSQREKSDNFTLDENMTYASRQYGPAQAAERYVELQGEKTFDSGGQSRKMTYPEFYREAYASGKTPKEIVTLWGKAR